MLVLLEEHIFLTTFYGLYFKHQLHITIKISSSSYMFMVTFCEQLLEGREIPPCNTLMQARLAGSYILNFKSIPECFLDHDILTKGFFFAEGVTALLGVFNFLQAKYV